MWISRRSLWAALCVNALALLGGQARADGPSTLASTLVGSFSCGFIGRYNDFFGFDLQLASRLELAAAERALLRGKAVKATFKLMGRSASEQHDHVLFDGVVNLKQLRGKSSFILSQGGRAIFGLRPPLPRELKPETGGLVVFDVDIVLVRLPTGILDRDFKSVSAVSCVAVQ
jgi:hypothetical protein